MIDPKMKTDNTDAVWQDLQNQINSRQKTTTELELSESEQGTAVFAFFIWPMIMLFVLPIFLLIGGFTFTQAAIAGIGMFVISLIAALGAYFLIGFGD